MSTFSRTNIRIVRKSRLRTARGGTRQGVEASTKGLTHEKNGLRKKVFRSRWADRPPAAGLALIVESPFGSQGSRCSPWGLGDYFLAGGSAPGGSRDFVSCPLVPL